MSKMLHTYIETFRDHSQTIWLNFKNSSCTLTTMYGTLLCILHFIVYRNANDRQSANKICKSAIKLMSAAFTSSGHRWYKNIRKISSEQDP